MSEFSAEPDCVIEVGRVNMMAHLLIRDKETGEVFVNQRDRNTLDRDLKTRDEPSS